MCEIVAAVELDPSKKVLIIYNIKAKVNRKLNRYLNTKDC